MPDPVASTTPAAGAPAPDAAAPPAAPPPATVTVTQEQWDRMQAQLAHMTGVVETLQGQAGRPVVVERPPAAPTEPTYTDEQLAEMLESGEGPKILAAQRYITRQTMLPLAQTFDQFRGATIATAESLGRDIVEARGLIPHYKDPEIRRQVDAFMATLPPEARANKDALVLAHNYVVGQPENLKKIVEREVEAELRRRAGAAEGTPGPAGSRERVPERDPNAVPTVTELFGDAAAAAIRRQGRTPDEFAKRMSRGKFKSWADYAKHVVAQQAEEEPEEEAV